MTPSTIVPPSSPLIFATLIEIVDKERLCIIEDIENLSDGEVLSFEEAARFEVVKQTYDLVSDLERATNAVEKITRNDDAQFLKYRDMEGALIDELLAKTIDDLVGEIEELHHDIDMQEVREEVTEACQEDGEDEDVVESSLEDLEEGVAIPEHEAALANLLEQVVLYLAKHLLIKEDGEAVSSMQKLNGLIG